MQHSMRGNLSILCWYLERVSLVFPRVCCIVPCFGELGSVSGEQQRISASRQPSLIGRVRERDMDETGCEEDPSRAPN